MLPGPILYYRGMDGAAVRLAITVMLPEGEAPPPLRIEDAATAGPVCLAARCRRRLWRYKATVTAGRAVRYAVGSRAGRIDVAPIGEPLRLAYTSCNGWEDEARDPQPEVRRNALWRCLAVEHAVRPFHLLLQGGDQLYADDVWAAVPELAAWARLGWSRRLAAPFPDDLAEAVGDYYFDRYCRLWSQPAIAQVLAAVPSLMMWDDHDIFDGWGSHDPELQACPVYQGVFAAAREQFALFQLGARPDALPDGYGDRGGGHFGWAGRIGGVGVVVPDLRSERTDRRVMGEGGWRFVETALAGLTACSHVLVMSSVPFANVNLSPVERVMVLLPGAQLYQDDLRDQWMSYAHREEWCRLADRLFAVSQRLGVPVTVVSGEIHFGGLGRIDRGPLRIVQLTSSGIAHPPPSTAYAWLLDRLGRPRQRRRDGTAMQVLPLPGLGRRFLAARNWLALDIARDGNLVARWHHDGAWPTPLTWTDDRAAVEPGRGADYQTNLVTR